MINRVFQSVAVCVFFAGTAFCQKIDNVTFSLGTSLTGKQQYNIYYDLLAPYDSIPCEVKVKVTADEKTFYSEAVTGDVGNLVFPGVHKQIVWDHVQELIHYSGSASLELEVTPNIKAPKNIKKGKSLTLEVAPIFMEEKKYTINLYRKGIQLAKLNEIAITGATIPVALPPKSKARKNYQIVISDGEHNYYSNAFKVKPKVGRFWKVLPIIAIPGYIVIKNYLDSQESLPEPPNSFGN